MPSPWLAVEVGTNPRTRARELRHSWEHLLAGVDLEPGLRTGVAANLRQTIVESWQRSLDSGLDPTDLLAPVEADPSETRERWAEHPLGSLAHVLADQLGTIAEDSQSLIVVSDASGVLLRIEGAPWLKERAGEMNFVEGARYSEAAAGTNGIGTVLAADHALQVFASEHFNQRHHGWTCSGAPIHDPMSGRLVGVVDLSSPWRTVHPLGLALVSSAARVMEQALSDVRRDQDARLRRRYGDLTTTSTDLLVSPDGYVLAGDRPATNLNPLDVPEGGGEVLLGDGSVAAAEPLGHGEAYLVRRIGPCSFGTARTKALERADEEAGGQRRDANVASGFPSTASDRRVSAYFEAALDCVIMADASGRVVEFNPAAERTFGYSRDEALGRTIAELIVPPSLRELHSSAFARFTETRQGTVLGRRLELTGMRADGSEFPVELALSQVAAEPLLICGALRDISAAKQAESHLRELADEQAALRRVATLVARESSPQQLFAGVAEQVARIIDVPLVRLIRYESDGSAVELIGGWGESVDPLALGTRWQLDGPGVLASVLRSGRPARLDDYTDVPGQAAVAVRQAGMRSAVASPITVEGRLWGAIAVLSPRKKPLPESTEARLADFTELVATALANAQSRAELAASEERARKLAEEQAALRRVATLVANESSPDEIFALVAAEVGQVLCVPIVALVRYETAGSAMRVMGGWSESSFPVPMGTRLLLDGPSHFADVWATGRPARLDDPTDLPGEIAAAMRQAGVGSGAASPILVEGRIWGAIAVGLFGSSDRLPDDIEARLADFTELVATALANSEAREGRRVLLEEQAALRRVATLVAEGASAGDIFSSVAREVAQVFDVRLVTVCRYESDAVVVLASLGVPDFPGGSRWPHDVPGLAATIYETGRPARIDDFTTAVGLDALAREAGVTVAVGVPIVVEGSVWGVVTLNAGEQLPPDTEHRLEKFTELVTSAIANAEAGVALRVAADEQAALRRVATLVAASAAPSDVFAAVTAEIALVLDADATLLCRADPGGAAVVVGSWGDNTPRLGTRLPQGGRNLTTLVLDTGRPARIESYVDATGDASEVARSHGLRSAVGAPILVEGRLWGLVIAGTTGDDALGPNAEERLAGFSELVATAISNATARAELAASRARVIATADETRRRIERDLHDGAQQQLVTLALELRATQGRVPPGMEELGAEVTRAADGLTVVLEELREISRGIHPAILTEGGLAPALKALARRSAVPVEIEVRCDNRLEEGVEVAAYYVVSEALANAAKHAGASRVQIALRLEQATLYLSIRDDGVGGADPTRGSGLMGLRDRVEALGGRIEVMSAPGSGTRLQVEIPLPSNPTDSPTSEELVSRG